MRKTLIIMDEFAERYPGSKEGRKHMIDTKRSERKRAMRLAQNKKRRK